MNVSIKKKKAEALERLKEGEATSYVCNHDTPYCSEIGSIGIALIHSAGLRRIW